MREHAGAEELIASNALAAASADGFPLTPGHTLIVPRRHEP
jgi:diadenosine tetraphosphate (Ap4A) HIT family hydrolase